MEDKNLFDGMKSALQKQVKDAYMEGAHQGAITTCAIIYGTMKGMGLEEDNFLMQMLKDLASQHGNTNLEEVAERLKNKH